MTGLRESDDEYLRVVVRLNDRWRVTLCRDALQFILQHRDGAGASSWRGRRFCTMRATLLRDVREMGVEASEEAIRELGALPPYADQMRAVEASKLAEATAQ